MASKYEDIIGKLSREPQIREYQAKIDMRKRELLEAVSFEGVHDLKVTLPADTPQDLTRAYATLRDRREGLEESLKNVNLALTALIQMIDARFEAEGVGSIRVGGVGALDFRREPTAQVTDREAFRIWSIENGLECSLAMNPKTREGLVRHRLLDGLPEPDGIKTYWRPKVTLRRE